MIDFLSQRPIGRTGISVTALGLGGAPFGNMYAAMAAGEAEATVAAAFAAGIRYFDTAPLYGYGLSETRLGEAIKPLPRDELVIASKVGFDLMALIGVGVAPGMIRDVADVMSQLPEASYVARVAGRFDLIVEVVCRDTAHFSALLSDRMQAVDGVLRTESFLILGIDKMAYGWDVRTETPT